MSFTKSLTISFRFILDLQNALTSDNVQNMAVTATTTSLTTSPTIKTAGESPKKKKIEEIKAIRIANNSISNLQILSNPFVNLFDTKKVSWLDLSFNQIEKINSIIFEIFPNVTALYLQANQISRLSEIKKLENFPLLKSLTIFGNPVEEHKHYRNYVLYFCKALTNFDLSPVTKKERTMVSTSYIKNA
jgi:Leucine-rich repeat (LRR) protein